MSYNQRYLSWSGLVDQRVNVSLTDGSELHGELLFVDPVEATMLLLPHDAADVDGRHGECAQQQRAIMVFASAVRGVATQ